MKIYFSIILFLLAFTNCGHKCEFDVYQNGQKIDHIIYPNKFECISSSERCVYYKCIKGCDDEGSEK